MGEKRGPEFVLKCCFFFAKLWRFLRSTPHTELPTLEHAFVFYVHMVPEWKNIRLHEVFHSVLPASIYYDTGHMDLDIESNTCLEDSGFPSTCLRCHPFLAENGEGAKAI